jgi:hypothetical protein
MKKHIQKHRNKFFVVLAIIMVVVFTRFMWPVEEGAVKEEAGGTQGLSVP